MSEPVMLIKYMPGESMWVSVCMIVGEAGK